MLYVYVIVTNNTKTDCNEQYNFVRPQMYLMSEVMKLVTDQLKF